MATLTSGEIWGRIVIGPADVPAAELPDAEPTTADLLAIEVGDETVIDQRVTTSLRIAALEHTHRELMELRREFRSPRPAGSGMNPTTFWRAA